MNNIKNIYLFCVIASFLLLGCKKYIKDDYPEECGCERFAGQYLMYDSLNDSYYELIIECDRWEEGQYGDSIVFQNYANLFSFSMQAQYYVNDPNHISGVNLNPLKDHIGNSWSFSNAGYGGITGRWNRVVNDSLYIRFTIDNTPYYAADGVPFYSCVNCRHYGVKIH